jgi:hypothetical protein
VEVVVCILVVEGVWSLAEDFIILRVFFTEEFDGFEGIHKDTGSTGDTIFETVQELKAGRCFHVAILDMVGGKGEEGKAVSFLEFLVPCCLQLLQRKGLYVQRAKEWENTPTALTEDPCEVPDSSLYRQHSWHQEST